MERKLEQVSLIVERYLGEILGRIRVYREGHHFLIPWGSTAITVRVYPEEEEVFVELNAPVALRVKPTKDLMRFLLSENGHLKGLAFFTEFEEGYMDVFLGTRLRYRDLSYEFFKYLVLNLGSLANEYGTEIRAVFGGLSFKEYLERRKGEYPYLGEKLFKEKIKVGDKTLVLEVFARGDEYTLVCREDGKSELFIKARRHTENVYEVLRLLEEVKKALERADFNALRRALSPVEVDFFRLYELFVKGKNASRLKELEKEIHELPLMLMRGEISYEEYRERIKRIEREIGL
ncbi:MAG: YbjN domain-containing protein [Aquificae bacterium]|nr:YbjN domain-containing protein [Aquificota bacterium]